MDDPEAGSGGRHDGAADDRRHGISLADAQGMDHHGNTVTSGPDSADVHRPVGTPPKPLRRRKHRRGRRKVFARPDVGAEATTPVVVARPAALPDVGSGDAGPANLDRQGPSRERSISRPLFAALDLGTNNCRLLVAMPTAPGQFRIVDAFSRIVRLGEGLSATGRLSQAAMDRALDALKVCGAKLRARPLIKTRLVATEACRSAANGVEFLENVRREAEIELEIIDRRTEARLAVAGCGQLVDAGTDAVVLFDIGGGSSEIALVDISRQRTPKLANHIVSWTSLPVGVVSLAERHGGREVTSAVFDAMVADVAAMIERFEGRDRLEKHVGGAKFHLLGTSGTVTTLAGVHLGLDRYDRRRVDGLWMNRTEVSAMIEKLKGWSFAERVANPCIGPDRADLVLAGCAILEAIRKVWPSERLRVADRGLREGILNELMSDEGVWRRGGRQESQS